MTGAPERLHFLERLLWLSDNSCRQYKFIWIVHSADSLDIEALEGPSRQLSAEARISGAPMAQRIAAGSLVP